MSAAADAYACPGSVVQEQLSRRQWLAARRRGVGGSDVPAILGMSRWDTPRDVWLDKTGRADEKPDTWAMRKGRALERDLLQWFSEQTGIPWVKTGLHRSIRRPWMLGTPDALIADGGIAECKTTGWRMRDEWADGPADAAQLQGQWYLAVTGRSHLWVIACIGDEEPTFERVERDEALIATLIEACGRFWHEYVVADVEPPLMWMDRDTVAREFATVARRRVDGDADLDYAITMRQQAVADIKRAEKVKAEAEARLIAALGDADHLVIDGKIAATRKAQTARVLDMEKVAAALAGHGDDIETYRVERPSRVLRVPDLTKRKPWKDID